MKALSQKEKKESVHILNEQEIQERLYGRYHKTSASLKESSRPAGPNGLTPPQLEMAANHSWKETGAWVARAVRAVARFLKTLPWRIAFFMSFVLAVIMFLSQSVPTWFHVWKENQTRYLRKQISESAPETVKSVHPEEVSSSEARPNRLNRAPVPNQKFYTVQVCTYQRERDAQDLVNQLQALQLPAFYQKASARDQGIVLYLVFLGQSASYADAKTQLEEFRKSSLFHKFSDSFIRSVTNSGSAA